MARTYRAGWYRPGYVPALALSPPGSARRTTSQPLSRCVAAHYVRPSWVLRLGCIRACDLCRRARLARLRLRPAGQGLRLLLPARSVAASVAQSPLRPVCAVFDLHSGFHPYGSKFGNSGARRIGTFAFLGWLASRAGELERGPGQSRAAGSAAFASCRRELFSACPTSGGLCAMRNHRLALLDRKSTRLNSSHTVISYAVFCLKKKKKKKY